MTRQLMERKRLRMTTAITDRDMYLALNGKNHWSGALPEPNAEGTDGPLASFREVLLRVAARKAQGDIPAPFTVWLRGGRYLIDKPIRLGPEHSAPVTFASYPGEEAVLEGGIRITRWTPATVNGCAAWVADVADLLGQYPAGFRQLFVNGQRCARARLPREGYFRMEKVPGTESLSGFDQLMKGGDRFVAAPGDFQAWRNLSAVDVVVHHFWTEQRMPVESFDPQTRMVVSTHQSGFTLIDDIQNAFAKYYVENVFEACTQPGDWYLDRVEQRLYYLPRPGEDPATTDVVAPVAWQLVRVEGRPADQQWVEFVRFANLTFRYTDWLLPPTDGRRFNPHDPAASASTDANVFEVPSAKPRASCGQAAWAVPGVLYFEGAHNCAVERCRIEHVGWYGIELADGCKGNRLVGNTLSDLGGGGIKLGGSSRPDAWRGRTGNNSLTDNHIHHGGEIFASACGVFIQHSFGNLVAHNHIHDLYYTGISCGWIWGYSESVTRENRIIKNHIHDLGKGVLSDMGGVYLLGVQPGTVVRGNLIHDIRKCNYGGWAVYPDEGASHIVIEDNVCYRTTSQPFHQHFGRENTVRNNIFAFGAEGVAAISRGRTHPCGYTHCGENMRYSVTFERNIFLTDGQPVYVGALGDATGRLEAAGLFSDMNLFWDIGGRPIVHGDGVHGKSGPENLTRAYDPQAWKKAGFDAHSVCADPRFRDPRAGDFALAPDSPALALGFRPIDVSDVGPRPCPA
jgi:hypothetical protein